MINGVGVNKSEQKKIELIKRLTNKGFNLQILAINALKDFLKYARIEDQKREEERLRQQKEKDRILRRIMDSKLRSEGLAFRQAYQYMTSERDKERILVAKQRGICNRIIDSNIRLMGAGYNKLIEAWKARRQMLRDKLKFIIASLTDKNKRYILEAYNGMKQTYYMLNGVGLGSYESKKISFIKRITNKGYNLQLMAVQALREFLGDARLKEQRAKEEYERQQKEKERIIKRIMDKNARQMGMAFRQALHYMTSERDKERLLVAKQRGILKRMMDSNVRVMGQGYNKLIEEWKARRQMLKDRLKFIIAS